MRRLLIALAATGLAACGSSTSGGGTPTAGPLTMTLNATMGMPGTGVTASFTGTVSPGWQGSVAQCDLGSTVCRANSVPVTASSSGALPPTTITILNDLDSVRIALRDPEGRILIFQDFYVLIGSPHTDAATGATMAIGPARGAAGTEVAVQLLHAPANADGSISLCAVTGSGAIVSVPSGSSDTNCDEGGGIAEQTNTGGGLFVTYKIVGLPTVRADQYAIVFQTSSGVVAEAPFTVTS